MGDLPPRLGGTARAKVRWSEEIGERCRVGTDKEEGGGGEQQHGTPTAFHGEVLVFLPLGVPGGPLKPEGVKRQKSMHSISLKRIVCL